MDVIELGGELELLTDRRLGDAESISDLALAHAGRDHRAQSKRTPQTRDVLTATGVAILRNQSHKMILSPSRSGDGTPFLQTPTIVGLLPLGLRSLPESQHPD